ncbi:hypothetical protein KHA96_14375 [Bacillus sp. FJAT-49711]|uniref:hypothetical protein n=1 Tax=Bacillus sp. FJAT-49711 TaxID=2833585 RepID=UPI001BC8E66B|nr:hypothetical protein [Bacillus sp. FJAT-49711]MBS4219499.1 hypothetical protein [Bacillus sp. FJAT-49711]
MNHCYFKICILNNSRSYEANLLDQIGNVPTDEGIEHKDPMRIAVVTNCEKTGAFANKVLMMDKIRKSQIPLSIKDSLLDRIVKKQVHLSNKRLLLDKSRSYDTNGYTP